MDFTKHIPTIEKKINYTFRDKSLLMQAFTRTSYCNEKNYRGRENFSSNEVLEFFGDSVLSTAIISLLLNEKTVRYPHGIQTELTEGDLSNIRSKLSDKRNLSRRTAELGLQKYLLLGEGDEKMMIAEEASVMEDLFESIIGAVYIDCGMNIQTVIGVVSGMLDVSEYADGEAPIQSYKNALQEWCADKSRRLPPPVYKTISESGPDHKKVYERGCYIGDKLYGTGKGKNQKLADTAAAEAALAALKSEAESTLEPTLTDSARALRTYAQEQKLKSPEYHDLGEAPESGNGERVYIVECCLGDTVASGKGRSKNDAREAASAKVLSLLRASSPDKSTKQTEKKQTAKGDKPEAKKPANLKSKAKATTPPTEQKEGGKNPADRKGKKVKPEVKKPTEQNHNGNKTEPKAKVKPQAKKQAAEANTQLKKSTPPKKAKSPKAKAEAQSPTAKSNNTTQKSQKSPSRRVKR